MKGKWHRVMNASRHMKYYAIILIMFSLFCLASTLLFVPPIHQWSSYHQFADTSKIFGIPNFMNVISNILFCLVAILGFVSLKQKWKEKTLTRAEFLAYFIIFIGIFLTGTGIGLMT